MTESDGRFRHCEGIVAQDAHGQTVLLRLADGFYYTLDAVAAEVWKLCDGQRAVEDIVRAVCEEFDAPPDVVREDVRAFLNELLEERLLDRVA